MFYFSHEDVIKIDLVTVTFGVISIIHRIHLNFFLIQEKNGKVQNKSVGVLEKIDANNIKIASPPVFRIISPIHLPYFSKKNHEKSDISPIFFSQIIPYFPYFLLILHWGACYTG